MHHPKRLVLLSDTSEPPTEFRLFPLGEIETTKGLFLLTMDDATACIERHRAYGNDLSIDYGHGVFNEHEGPQMAAGWIRDLELRPDGLWAAGVTWTERAAAMIRAREQRYFSPAFVADEDGHVTEILNVALTLMPATHNLIPLVASRRSGPVPAPQTLNKRTTTMDEKYVSSEELKKLAAEIDKMAEAEDKEKASLKALADKCRSLADGGETLAKLAEDAAPDSEKKEAEKASDDKKDDAEKTAEDEEKKEEAKAASRIVSAAREATGEQDPSRIVGALKALGESKGSVVALTARVAELEAVQKKADESARRERIASMVKASAVPGPDCKVTPAEVERLVHERETMGAVNLRAEEEAAELDRHAVRADDGGKPTRRRGEGLRGGRRSLDGGAVEARNVVRVRQEGDLGTHLHPVGAGLELRGGRHRGTLQREGRAVVRGALAGRQKPPEAAPVSAAQVHRDDDQAPRGPGLVLQVDEAVAALGAELPDRRVEAPEVLEDVRRREAQLRLRRGRDRARGGIHNDGVAHVGELPDDRSGAGADAVDRAGGGQVDDVDALDLVVHRRVLVGRPSSCEARGHGDASVS